MQAKTDSFFRAMQQDVANKDRKIKEQLGQQISKEEESARLQKEETEKSHQQQIVGAQESFKDSVAQLKSTMYLTQSITVAQHVALISLISQAQQIVANETPARVGQLSAIMNWANNALNGKVGKDDYKLLNEEIKKESFLDQRIHRIMFGIGEVIGGIVGTAALVPIFLFALKFDKSGVVTGSALSLVMISAALAVDGFRNLFFSRPNSVGQEVRTCAQFFPAPPEADLLSHDESEVGLQVTAR